MQLSFLPDEEKIQRRKYSEALRTINDAIDFVDKSENDGNGLADRLMGALWDIKDRLGEGVLYRVVIESGTVKKVALKTFSKEEAEQYYEALDNGFGNYVDENQFSWDLYIEEDGSWELEE